MQAHSYRPPDPYYPQTQYAQPQQAYYPQYSQFPPYYPPQQNAAFPVYPAQYDVQAQPEMPTPKPHKRKKSHRTAAAAAAAAAAADLGGPQRSGTPGAPLRSAMKKKTQPPDRTPSAVSVPLSRHRTNSDVRRSRLNSLTRPRSGFQIPFLPDHITVSLHSINELRIGNIAYQETMDELKEMVLPMWPHGIAMEDSRDSEWCIRFIGKPWTSVGVDALLAQRLICRLFLILAAQGYSYLATVNTGNPMKPARLIFVDSPADKEAYFFLGTFSRSTDKLTLLDAPAEMVYELGDGLRGIFPHRIVSHGTNENGIHVIELKAAGLLTPAREKSLFTTYVLHFFNAAGFKLDGSLSIGRRGRFGLGARKEVWVFRSVMRRPDSRQKHKQ